MRRSHLDALVIMQHILEDPLMRNSAILVFANKQDMVRSAASTQRFSLSKMTS